MASLASIALSVALLAQTTAPAPDVAALIARLAADDTADRDAAQQAILALGEDPTAALRAARPKAADPDVRTRIDALLVQSRERAELGASRITLKFDDAPLSAVIDELERQSRARFNELNAGGQETRVSIDVRDVTFWDAIQRIQQLGNVYFQPNGGNDGGWAIIRNGGRQNAIRGVESGAFLFQPMSANYNRVVNYMPNNGADSETFNFQMTMLAEPKIRLGEQAAQIVIDRARDSNDNDLLPNTRNPTHTGVSQSSLNCSVQLAYPKQAADRIAEISGTVRLAVASRVVTIETDDLFAGGPIERQLEGGLRITIEPGRPGDANAGANPANPANLPDARVELGVTVDRGNAGANVMADQVQRALIRTRVTDPSGRLMQQAGVNNVSSDGTRQTYRVSFVPQQGIQRRPDGTTPPPPEGPYKLRIELPVGFRSVEVPFSFKDLKMP